VEPGATVFLTDNGRIRRDESAWRRDGHERVPEDLPRPYGDAASARHVWVPQGGRRNSGAVPGLGWYPRGEMEELRLRQDDPPARLRTWELATVSSCGEN